MCATTNVRCRCFISCLFLIKLYIYIFSSAVFQVRAVVWKWKGKKTNKPFNLYSFKVSVVIKVDVSLSSHSNRQVSITRDPGGGRPAAPASVWLLIQCPYLAGAFGCKLVAWCFLVLSRTRHAPCAGLVSQESWSRNSLLAVKLRKEHQAAGCHLASQLGRGRGEERPGGRMRRCEKAVKKRCRFLDLGLESCSGRDAVRLL